MPERQGDIWTGTAIRIAADASCMSSRKMPDNMTRLPTCFGPREPACSSVRPLTKRWAGLDAGFFAHQEEIDLCWRLRSRGYRLVCTPSSVVYHVGGATLNVESPRKTFLNFRNNLLMLYKNLPEKDLKHVMHARFWLDYIAAAKFLLTGHYPNARAVYEARKAFHELKPSYEPVRRENLAKTKLSGIPELRKGSLILAFYLQGKKRFTEL